MVQGVIEGASEGGSGYGVREQVLDARFFGVQNMARGCPEVMEREVHDIVEE